MNKPVSITPVRNKYVVIINGNPMLDVDIADDFTTYVDAMEQQIQESLAAGYGTLRFKAKPGVAEYIVTIAPGMVIQIMEHDAFQASQRQGNQSALIHSPN